MSVIPVLGGRSGKLDLLPGQHSESVLKKEDFTTYSETQMDLADMLSEINQLQRSCVVCDFTTMRHSKAEMKVGSSFHWLLSWKLFNLQDKRSCSGGDDCSTHCLVPLCVYMAKIANFKS